MPGPLLLAANTRVVAMSPTMSQVITNQVLTSVMRVLSINICTGNTTSGGFNVSDASSARTMYIRPSVTAETTYTISGLPWTFAVGEGFMVENGTGANLWATVTVQYEFSPIVDPLPL